MLGSLVDADGLLVPIGSGSSWEYSGPVGKASKINLSVKKGEDIAYRVYSIGPKRRFERVDPRPVALSRQTSVAPSVPQALRDYIDQALKARGIDLSAQELLEDVDDDFGFDDALPFENFGEGRMDDDSPEGDRMRAIRSRSRLTCSRCMTRSEIIAPPEAIASPTGLDPSNDGDTGEAEL